MTQRFRPNLHRIYTGWYSRDPRKIRTYDADFADSYTLIGERMLQTLYISDKIIEPGDDGETPVLYDHEHELDHQPAKLWIADGYRDPGETDMVFLGDATLMRWFNLDGEEEQTEWSEGAAKLCALDRRTVCVVEPRRHLVTLVMTGVVVGDDGLSDRPY